MKVTKYPQSCLLLEKDSKRIVIDPGSFFTKKYSIEELGKVEAALYTHRHPDHLDQGLAHELLAKQVDLYGNDEVASLLGGDKVLIIQNGQTMDIAGFSVKAADMPHFKLPDGSEPPKNTAFIVDGTLLHPGDSTEGHGLTVRDIALTVGGPTGEQFVDEAVEFAKRLQAKRVIPIHYDFFTPDPKSLIPKLPEVEVIVLDDGQSVEL